MSVRIKSPNPDDIWDKWKQKTLRTQKKKIEKAYRVKGAVFSIENIGAAEYVKNVAKEAAIYFEKSLKIDAPKVKPRDFQVNWRKLESVKFFDFKSEVDKTQWKFDEEVPSFKSISKIQCSDCNGRGYYEKKKSCSNCKDGNYHVILDVYNEKGDKSNREFEMKCPKCFGEGYFVEREPCKTCNGTGILFRYQTMAVPFRKVSQREPVFLTSTKVSGIEKKIGKEIQDAIQNVGGIQIRNPDKELDEKFIEPNLGYMTKGIKSIIKNAKKQWKEASKNEDLTIHTPIYIFPLIQLECATIKGKKFYVYSVGSADKFIVAGNL
ncbi:MAG: DnaJ-like cysteine-rich domain-containing protein [Promethearchaeota archaeon]